MCVYAGAGGKWHVSWECALPKENRQLHHDGGITLVIRGCKNKSPIMVFLDTWGGNSNRSSSLFSLPSFSWSLFSSLLLDVPAKFPFLLLSNMRNCLKTCFKPRHSRELPPIHTTNITGILSFASACCFSLFFWTFINLAALFNWKVEVLLFLGVCFIYYSALRLNVCYFKCAL